MSTLPDFTYTGQYTLSQSGGNWELRLLTSGVLSVGRTVRTDLFALGGGGGGGSGNDIQYGGGGGGGGYAVNARAVTLVKDTAYSIVIGAGGGSNTAGQASSALGVTANGGGRGGSGVGNNGYGGSGGSGGGRGALIDNNAGYGSSGNGGTDGGNGGTVHGGGGSGQGTTTRVFGESGGTLRGGGGGGGSAVSANYIDGYYGTRNSGVNAPGGAGGGATGGGRDSAGQSAAANTGGGGGGGGCNSAGGSGGSGLVAIRNTRYGAASFISAADGLFGAPVTITLNRDSSTATHTITAKLLAADGTTVLHSETVATLSASYPTLSWTPAVALYAPLITDRTSAAFQLECVTFDEGDEIGTETLDTPITLSFQSADIAPALSAGAAAAGVYNTGAVAGLTGFVQGYSRAHVTFSDAAVTLRYGAAIASRSISCQGETVSAAPYLTPVLTGDAGIICRVTDSRGLYAELTISVAVLPYQTPRLSGISLFRCDSAGTASADGAGISAKATVIFSALAGENSAALTAAVRTLAGVYGAEESIAAGTAQVLGAVTDPDLSYMVRLTATDALGNTAVFEQKIPLRKWALKFRPDGDGAAFGKAPAAAKTLEIPEDWEIVRGAQTLGWGVADGSVTTAKIAENAVTLAKLASDVTAALGGVRVSATGTDGYWTYRKYSDGTFDAWATVSGTITNGYCSGSLPGFTVGAPQMFTSANYDDNAAMNVIVIVQAKSNGFYNLYFRNGSGGNITGGYSVNMQLHGNWQ
ncbi:MAG: DUF859 family phage minor structural protein [Oscillospiraceae bacterium]|nr:DUF859 family phage minor structural protein [Oscillospiraceae bacterium]